MLGPIEAIGVLFRIALEVVSGVGYWRFRRGQTVSTKRKSSIYRRGVSVPTTAKVRLGDDEIRD